MPLSRLNEEQLAAATAPFGHNLVIASAGTGKTSTIVGRIGYLLSKGVDPRDILLLTFTNKAAAEMVERVAGYFSREVAAKIEAGTFHAVSYRHLKREREINLKQPFELKTLFRSIYEKRRFHHIGAETEPFASNFLYDLHSLYQNATKEPFEEWLSKRHKGHEPYIDIYLDIIDEFKSSKEEFGFVDFNDLLIMMRESVKRKPLAFREILIDEYQDTNELQGSLIDAMNAPSLFCVGDYDQSIYAFNGANINIIGSFAAKFDDARVFTLTKNYRSTAPILELANRVIEYNERIYPKQLEVVRKGDSAARPKLLIFDNLMQQYETIAQSIRRSTTPHHEIAVIFRNNASADGIEAMLKEEGISCRRKGGRSFFDAKEVKAALDFATLLLNPKDMMAFIHIFEYARGVGSATAKELFEGLTTLGDGCMVRGLFDPKPMTNPFKARNTNYQLGLFDHPMQIGSVSRFSHLGLDENFMAHPILKHPALNSDGVKFLYDFYRLIKRLKSLKQPHSIMRHILSSDLYGYITERLAERRATLKNGEIDGAKRVDALERIKRKGLLLVRLAEAYGSNEKFINAMVLGGRELNEGEGVNLLTVHASKGLEFDEVYVIDLMDGRFPNRKLAGQGGSIEEERRLFYVALTRARDILYLSYAKYDSFKDITFFPSQFLYEAGLLKKDGTYERLKALSAP